MRPLAPRKALAAFPLLFPLHIPLRIPLLAMLAVLPLVFGGVSQGHDFTFHLQSWIDASAQMRHGTLFPQWARTPAWQAGEPRFLFYPPLSWTLGAVLVLVLPVTAVPLVFLWLAFTGAGLAMYGLAREFVPRQAALVAAAFYLANPYMLFNAYERSAYAELLAATWIPLILLAALRDRPSPAAIAAPLALVWLTNAPSAVMGTYLLALVAALRLAAQLRAGEHRRAGRLLIRTAAGALLGFALPSFYLLPAAWDRRYVQVDMAVIPNMRYQDNFLFSRTNYEPHNVVGHTVSVLAVWLLCGAALGLGAAWGLRRRVRQGSPVAGSPVTGSDSLRPGPLATARALKPLSILSFLTAAVLFLLLPLSAPVWEHVPELKFLQFPWRLLTILSAVLALIMALLSGWTARRRAWAGILLLALSFGQSLLIGHVFRQQREPAETAAALLASFHAHHGVPPTDEYTATDADNDVLRTDNPGFWLAGHAGDAAPGTTPNPAERNPDYDAPVPPEHTVAAQAPLHLSLDLPTPEVLVLNLRDFHNWRVLRNGTEALPELPRDDGLIAVALPSGHSDIAVAWHRGWEGAAGAAVSAVSLLGLSLSGVRSRKLRSKGVGTTY